MAIHPGAIALTRMSGPRLIARACVSATRPPFVVEYASVFGSDISARVEVRLRIDPLRARRCGIAARETMRVPVRLTSSMRRQSARSSSSTGVCQPRKAAASLITTSRPPPQLTVASMARFTALSSEMSATCSCTGPRADISSHASSPTRLSTSTSATFAPSSSNRAAIARPMPLPAPVTSATRPENRSVIRGILHLAEQTRAAIVGIGLC